MTTLTVTAKGQVTLKRDVLEHLGVKPGDRIEVDKLPDGRVSLKPARRRKTLDEVVGCLAPYTSVKATLEEIDQAIADGWAGKR
jgi:antitoxin PrlF